ncbi:hypothetical protein N5C93_27420 [Pseudomonas nitroreducens]|uniref:VWFA domain-containing protein n=1 Tax=Pseudomonas nitroreducens TaxID=46680 RepID=A0ABS0KN04_PSENT|nr:VWA domain-containing protein [Pseudomonas nitroreducens]MBG6289467.1 hypothetical protein [Pseudomonas nitroreducens]MDG9857338.1 hypothetical protein [Pseudomonas nitroreducens]MDH1076568.1 hypothetical protein [Pseudomonas nitroreducens]
MSAKSLVGSLPIYAQHLAEKTGVKVYVEGSVAYTNVKREVYVPFADDDLDLAFGYIDHECSHVRNTDLEAFEQSKSVAFRRHLLNALEDIRIERLSMEQYPGTEDNLRYLNRKVLLEPFVAASVDACPPLHVVANAVLFGGYWLLQEPQLEVPAKAYLARLDSLIGTDAARSVVEVVKRTLDCGNTWEVLQLVDEIIALLPSSSEAPRDKNEPQSGDANEPGSPEADESDQAGQQPNQDEAGSTGGDASEVRDQGAVEPCDGPAEASRPSAPGESTPDNVPNLRELAMGASEADLDGLVSDVGDVAAALLTQGAKSNPPNLSPFTLGGRAMDRSQMEGESRVRYGVFQSSGLQQCLYGLLQAKVDCRASLRRSGKRLDTGRLAMLPAGETRIYRHKARAERSSAAVQLLLDKSGSMRESIGEAEAAIYAVLHALESIPQVTTGAMSFPNMCGDGVERCALIKSWRERLVTAVREGGFGASAQGLTPLYRAIWPAACEVLGAPGERKLLLIATDGEPDSGTEQQVRELVARCEASGIEVFGLGFGKATATVLAKCFSRYQAIGQVSNLKNALYELVREALVA